MGFADNLKNMPGIAHIEAIRLLDGEEVVAQVLVTEPVERPRGLGFAQEGERLAVRRCLDRELDDVPLVIPVEGPGGLALLGRVDDHEVLVDGRRMFRPTSLLQPIAAHQDLAAESRLEDERAGELPRLPVPLARPLAHQESEGGPGITIGLGAEGRRGEQDGQDT